ncbi:glycoside hydrolase family 16 protein [Algoriphagus lutimaris]|uniref:glycoside hydrolase family 16 protein n=1 Tax=Algoriphagus lutimaris TaxID=613197 RepID=UPI00196A9008|nr:glycoside hydrolase family 16 protein [Algoriphagus lutimaris]MBN3521173.1 glycoside hydrolase family 16 protein [Algoriphagus lutimaris]
MNIIFRSLFVFLVAAMMQPSFAQEIPAGYQLVWQDEFNEEGSVDLSTWNFEKGFVRNNELQWYQEANASQKNGILLIQGRREKLANPAYESGSDNWKKAREFADYTSSSINTRGKFEFQYGILEVRAKIDTASGMWPAIWTLGISKPWPANGEIDVMEFYQVKGEQTILANAAWADATKRANWDEAKIPLSEFLENDPQWADEFHIWKMDWTEESIKIYLDEVLLNEIDLSKTLNPDGFNPFHQPHYILLNLAIGSNGGDPSPTDFPREYQVDYVRVYQRK